METQTAISQVGTWNARNLLIVSKVAELARVHPKTIYRWTKEGKLEAFQFRPRCFCVPEDAIPQLLRKVSNVLLPFPRIMGGTINEYTNSLPRTRLLSVMPCLWMKRWPARVNCSRTPLTACSGSSKLVTAWPPGKGN